MPVYRNLSNESACKEFTGAFVVSDLTIRFFNNYNDTYSKAGNLSGYTENSGGRLKRRAGANKYHGKTKTTYFRQSDSPVSSSAGCIYSRAVERMARNSVAVGFSGNGLPARFSNRPGLLSHATLITVRIFRSTFFADV